MRKTTRKTAKKAIVNAQIETLYEDYIENPAQNELEAALAELSGKLDDCTAITASDLAQYEEAARHAAFYAGFNAAQTAPTEADTATEDYLSESTLIQLFRGLNIKNRAMIIACAQGKRETQ